MPKGLLIHNLQAGSLDVELLPKLLSALGEVVPLDIEQLGEAGDALQYAETNHCEWIAVAGGDGNFLWALFPRAHLTTLLEASTPSTPAKSFLQGTHDPRTWAS